MAESPRVGIPVDVHRDRKRSLLLLLPRTTTRAAGAVLFAALGLSAIGATTLHHESGRGSEADIVNVGVQDVPGLSGPQNQQCTGTGSLAKPCLP
jgi:hypothetical protein